MMSVWFKHQKLIELINQNKCYVHTPGTEYISSIKQGYAKHTPTAVPLKDVAEHQHYTKGKLVQETVGQKI